MNFDVVGYELRFVVVRKGRKLRETVLRIFTAYRGISRVRLARFEQRWNEDESSSVHRETVAFTMWVKIPASSKISSGGSSNPTSIHPRTKSNCRKRGQNLDYDSWMTDVEKTLLETLVFKYVYFDTVMDVTVKQREQRIGRFILPVWRTEKCTKSQN